MMTPALASSAQGLHRHVPRYNSMCSGRAIGSGKDFVEGRATLIKRLQKRLNVSG